MKLLSEEKSSSRTVADCYKELVDERKKELEDTPEIATWTYGTWKKHNTMLNHWLSFKPALYFEDITLDLLDNFEKFLIEKGLSNRYVSKSMVILPHFSIGRLRKGIIKTKHSEIGSSSSMTVQKTRRVFSRLTKKNLQLSLMSKLPVEQYPVQETCSFSAVLPDYVILML